MKRTPLYQKHLDAGGRVVDFAGWEMPVQYKGILDEHKAVRSTVGVFDISHMGEFFVSGPGVAAWLDGLLTNRVAILAEGQGQYTLMLNENGGVIDDLIVYRFGAEEYLLIVNASMIDEDAAWIQAHLAPGIKFDNASDRYAAIAVQGPEAPKLFTALFGTEMPEKNRIVKSGETFAGITGYTGEDGFELFVPAAEAEAIWDQVLALGAKPCGLGARDTLRLEMAYPLNGSDLSPKHTPLEAGLGFFVDLEKEDFIGKPTLLAQKQTGLPCRLVAIQVLDKAPPIRSHYPVVVDDAPISETSSGALSPSLGYGIAMAYLPVAFAKVGQEVAIDVRGKQYRAQVVKKPFYRPANR